MLYYLQKIILKRIFPVVIALIMMGYPVAVSADTTATITTTPSPATTTSQSGDTHQTTSIDEDGAITANVANPETPKTSPDTQSSVTDSPSKDKTTDTITTGSSSTAKTGDATVSNNGTAGNATSGNASVTSNTINSVQSNTGLTSSTPATFTTDIYGNKTGDISIANPNIIGNNQIPDDLQIKSGASGQIVNNISVSATSGNASVVNNDTAGNATSGNASASVNIANILGSTVSSNKTFVGTINIYGSLNGNIILPASSLTDIVPSNSIPISASSPADEASHQNITNNISTAVTSGNSTVSNNGTAGNATSGNASASVNILNTSNENFSGTDAVAVFVNVLGHWLGYIVGAPVQSTAAVLGDGGQASITTSKATNEPTDSRSTTITNNVVVNSTSGNSTVSNNGTAGNATSGNASASVNILNMTNDNINLSNWFGVLFINVFGSWTGNVTAEPSVDTNTSNTNNSGSDLTTSAAVQNNEDQTASQFNSPRTAILASETNEQTPSGLIPARQNTSVSSSAHAVLSASTVKTLATITRHNSSPQWHFAAMGLSFSVLLVISDLVITQRKAHA